MDSSDTTEFDGHGGDLAAAEGRFGAPPAPGWLDLSTGINPFPYPNVDVASDVLHRLPSSAALERLIVAARGYYRVPQGAVITAAAGTQQLIQSLPRLLPGATVSIAGPTYSEHELAWRRAGRAIVAENRAEIAVVVNPNNPDGRIMSSLPVAQTIIIDEAFGDIAPETTSVAATARGKVIVLKSFGKFFGLAGLRLGFCISAPPFARNLAELLGPWAVSGLAIEIGARALGDTSWIAATRERLAEARRDLDRVLTAAGLEVIGGTDLFTLVASPAARAIRDHLGRSGILVRGFADRPTLLRIGLPGSKTELVRLETALATMPGRAGERTSR